MSSDQEGRVSGEPRNLSDEVKHLRQVAKEGWETARLLAIQFGARRTEQAAEAALDDLEQEEERS